MTVTQTHDVRKCTGATFGHLESGFREGPRKREERGPASLQAWARALAPTVRLAFPSGSRQGTREGEAAGPAQPPPERIRKHRLLTSLGLGLELQSQD